MIIHLHAILDSVKDCSDEKMLIALGDKDKILFFDFMASCFLIDDMICQLVDNGIEDILDISPGFELIGIDDKILIFYMYIL